MAVLCQTIDPRIPTMPERSKPGFHRPEPEGGRRHLAPAVLLFSREHDITTATRCLGDETPPVSICRGAAYERHLPWMMPPRLVDYQVYMYSGLGVSSFCVPHGGYIVYSSTVFLVEGYPFGTCMCNAYGVELTSWRNVMLSSLLRTAFLRTYMIITSFDRKCCTQNATFRKLVYLVGAGIFVIIMLAPGVELLFAAILAEGYVRYNAYGVEPTSWHHITMISSLCFVQRTHMIIETSHTECSVWRDFTFRREMPDDNGDVFSEREHRYCMPSTVRLAHCMPSAT